jgi:hypothetical protein
MANTKTIEVKTNWLDAIDGMTVANAIEYLKTLDQSHTLDYSMEGDTHGCSVESRLTYEVPKSNAEIYADLEKHYLKQIGQHEKSKAYYLSASRQDRADHVETLIAALRSKLEQAKGRYCAE